mmetsp:Transcript_15386/g.30253  ORF Transcript_15386/g.30253 Transcript_15386/m.30253 type:complete len:290 (+) Transcript_15386:27-896(+)
MSDASSRFAASSFAALIAETITLPTDVAKVRLQVQKSSNSSSTRYTGLLDCLTKTYQNEGSAALFKGLQPALVRQICYTSFAMVLYEPILNSVASASERDGKEKIAFWKRLFAGGASGGISISIFNPTEVVKTKMQTTTTSGRSMFDVVRSVYATDGILGFWAGVRPNVMRTLIVNAAELGVYDEAKTQLAPYFDTPMFTHVSASAVAGLSSALTSTPADVIKTRLMNSAGGAKEYSGMLDAGTSILKQEGVSALYKGFIPIFVRKVIWVTAFFVSYEQLRPICTKAMT